MLSKVTDFIIKFESGGCANEEEIFEGFQMLLDEDVLFKLQGFYGRMGMQMLERGFIHLPKDRKVLDAYGNEVTVGMVQ